MSVPHPPATAHAPPSPASPPRPPAGSRRQARVPPRHAAVVFPRFDVQLALTALPRLATVPFALLLQKESGQFGRVLGCNAAARRQGVVPGMSASEAGRRAELVALDLSLRDAAVCALEPVAESFTPEYRIEPGGEMFLDLTGTERLFGGDFAAWSEILRARATAATGLRLACIGIASTRTAALLLARALSDGGFEVCPPGGERARLAGIPCTCLPHISDRARAQIERYNLATLGDIQRLPRLFLGQHFGTEGDLLHALAQGVDPGPEPSRAARGLAVEHIPPRDFNDLALIREKVHFLADLLGFRLRQQGVSARELRLLVEYSDGRVERASGTVGLYTHEFVPLRDAALSLVDQACTRRVSVRRLELRAMRTADCAPQGDLFDGRETERLHALQASLDRVRRKLGFDALLNAVNYLDAAEGPAAASGTGEGLGGMVMGAADRGAPDIVANRRFARNGGGIGSLTRSSAQGRRQDRASRTERRIPGNPDAPGAGRDDAIERGRRSLPGALAEAAGSMGTPAEDVLPMDWDVSAAFPEEPPDGPAHMDQDFDETVFVEDSVDATRRGLFFDEPPDPGQSLPQQPSSRSHRTTRKSVSESESGKSC